VGLYPTLDAAYQAEPILMLLAANSAVLPAIFGVMSAFGHPLNDTQQRAVVELAAVVTAFVARQSVVAQDTHSKAVAEQQMATKLNGAGV